MIVVGSQTVEIYLDCRFIRFKQILEINNFVTLAHDLTNNLNNPQPQPLNPIPFNSAALVESFCLLRGIKKQAIDALS